MPKGKNPGLVGNARVDAQLSKPNVKNRKQKEARRKRNIKQIGAAAGDREMVERGKMPARTPSGDRKYIPTGQPKKTKQRIKKNPLPRGK